MTIARGEDSYRFIENPLRTVFPYIQSKKGCLVKTAVLALLGKYYLTQTSQSLLLFHYDSSSPKVSFSFSRLGFFLLIIWKRSTWL